MRLGVVAGKCDLGKYNTASIKYLFIWLFFVKGIIVSKPAQYIVYSLAFQ